MSRKLTPWYPPEIKPIRAGVYQIEDREYGHGIALAFWNGERFCYRTWGESVKNTIILSDRETQLPAFTYWRGLARKP